MPCSSPLKAFPIGFHPSGSVKYKICSFTVDHVELISGTWYSMSDIIRSSSAERVVRDWIEIPCGNCTFCRLQYSRQWADRCLLELQYHDSAYFVTLTYDDMHVPTSFYPDPETGEANLCYTLDKRDLQLFFKRLRKAFPNDHIRYYCAGEYGSDTHRPHYHCIIFGLHLDDLVFYRRTDLGYNLYNSSALQRVWSVRDADGVVRPIGFAVVGSVTWDSIAYTARYIMKKHKGHDAAYYETFNLLPEFTIMSRKPGIARQYFDDHPDCVVDGVINVSTEKGGQRIYSPKYFDRLYAVDYPEVMQAIKDKRKQLAEDSMKFKLDKTSLSYLEYLKVCESNLQARIKSLKREL